MRKILAIVAFLLIGGFAFADEVKVVKPVKPTIKVVPKTGVALPVVRPLPGRYYWNHPGFGWGYWYYPAPTVAVPQNYYLDEYGRVVPNGYAYDPYGNLIPLEVAAAPTPYYIYPYRYYYGRNWWWR